MFSTSVEKSRSPAGFTAAASAGAAGGGAWAVLGAGLPGPPKAEVGRWMGEFTGAAEQEMSIMIHGLIVGGAWSYREVPACGM